VNTSIKVVFQRLSFATSLAKKNVNIKMGNSSLQAKYIAVGLPSHPFDCK
jgi:hypothetical protein